MLVFNWMVELISISIDIRTDPTTNFRTDAAALLSFPTDIFLCKVAKNVCLIIFGVAFISIRSFHRKRLRQMVDKDHEQFAATFRRVRVDDHDDLLRIAQTCEKITQSLETCCAPLRQPTQDLAQLASQAAALPVLMDAKLSTWSAFYVGLGEPLFT